MQMRKDFEAAGLTPACLSAHSNLLDTCYGVDYLKKAIRFAYILGAPMVNTAEGPKAEWMTDDDAFRIMKYNIAELMRMCANYDITLTIEPHGIYTTNAEGLLRIMSLSDSPYLAINFDTGNTTIAGSDAVDTLKQVIDHVKHVHVKDVKREMAGGHVTGVTHGCAVGEGDVDVPACLDVLRGAGYDGCLSIECGGTEECRRSAEYLRSVL